jgi:site-specific DNA-methyltransferase (adenine-specific)
MKGMARKDMQVDSIVSDPPYNLASVVKRFGGKNAAPAKHGKDGAFSRASAGFMNSTWDSDVAFQAETWAAAYEVLKPGGHMLVFGGTRTYHRLVCAIEDAGFEIRDAIMWHYGSGMPHGQNISKMIDKKAGAERKVVGSKIGMPGYSLKPNDTKHHDRRVYSGVYTDAENECAITASSTDSAKYWDGWNTSLKPATEIICLARKPLSEKTIAANVLKHGTGAINIDACRVGTTKQVPSSLSKTPNAVYGKYNLQNGSESGHNPNVGRWPANVITDASEEVLAAFPITSSGAWNGKRTKPKHNNVYGKYGEAADAPLIGSKGSAARFFYSAKSGKKDRNFGLPDGTKNPHPTVKPLSLMTYLIKLITPVGGTTFDPFMGSGSTGIAAIQSGFKFVGSDLTEEYFDISAQRIAYAAGIENNEAQIKPKELIFLDEPENFVSPKDWTKRGLKNQSKG